MTTNTLLRCPRVPFVQSAEGHYGDLERDALLNAKIGLVEADERVSDVLGAPYPENEPCCRIL